MGVLEYPEQERRSWKCRALRHWAARRRIVHLRLYLCGVDFDIHVELYVCKLSIYEIVVIK